MTSGEPVISNAPHNDSRSGGLPPGHPRMDGFMGLPFFYNKKLVGMIGVANKIDGYSSVDVDLLAPFLATCSTLLKAHQNTVKKESAEKKAEQIKAEFTKNLEIKVSERTRDLEKIQKKLKLSLIKEKELGELKSRFVSIASHQFRTPLTVIQASIGVLEYQKNQMSEQLVPRFEKVHHRILEQINGMTSLMDDVLILGELNERSFTAELKSTDVVELCNTVIANYNDIQDDKRITVLKVVGEPVMVVLDEKLIGHAFSNLLSNAFKYSIGKQATMVSINFESNKVRISIKDDGIGIQEKDVKHLFEPFYRASNTLDISGTGLGSTVAKDYIELSKGVLGVNTELGKGSEFIIEFKLNNNE